MQHIRDQVHVLSFISLSLTVVEYNYEIQRNATVVFFYRLAWKQVLIRHKSTDRGWGFKKRIWVPDTFDPELHGVAWRLCCDRQVVSSSAGEWFLDGSHYVDVRSLHLLRLLPDDGVVKHLEAFHVELTIHQDLATDVHHVILTTWQHRHRRSRCGCNATICSVTYFNVTYCNVKVL